MKVEVRTNYGILVYYFNVLFFSNLHHVIPYSCFLCLPTVLMAYCARPNIFSEQSVLCRFVILLHFIFCCFFLLRTTLLLKHLPYHKVFAVGQNFHLRLISFGIFNIFCCFFSCAYGWRVLSNQIP